MDQPIFMDLDPQASHVNFPHVAWLPAHPSEELNPINMVEKYGL
jgi:hypothetical protein